MLTRAKLTRLRDQVSEDVRGPYLEEAFTCYRAGAFRMATVMISNAVHAHLLRKVEHLGGVNDKILKIANDANFQKREGDPFEQQLKQDAEKAGLLTVEQVQYLEELRIWRNDFAHPTTRAITPTKAGCFLKEAVELFLVEDSFDAHAIILEIEGRLKQPNFFPSAIPKRQSYVVEAELRRLHPRAHHSLMSAVVKLLAGSKFERANSLAFIRSCAALPIDGLGAIVVRHLFVPNLANEADSADPFTDAICSTLVTAPDCLWNLTERQQQQLDRKLAKLVEMTTSSTSQRSTPPSFFRAMVRRRPEVLEKALPTTAQAIISRFPTHPVIFDVLDRMEGMREMVLRSMRLEALHPNRARAAGFMEFAEQNADRLASLLTGVEAYALLTSISRYDDGLLPGSRTERLLRQSALDWYQQDIDAARSHARRSGLYDPTAFWSRGSELTVDRGEKAEKAA